MITGCNHRSVTRSGGSATTLPPPHAPQARRTEKAGAVDFAPASIVATVDRR